MYAVIRTGGKQHRVEKGERLKIEKLEGDVGAKVTLNEVLLIGGDGAPNIGKPFVRGASVEAKIVTQGKGPKVIAYKKRRRKGYDKTIGHRQPFTEIEITKIEG